MGQNEGTVVRQLQPTDGFDEVGILSAKEEVGMDSRKDEAVDHCPKPIGKFGQSAVKPFAIGVGAKDGLRLVSWFHHVIPATRHDSFKIPRRGENPSKGFEMSNVET